MCRRPNKKVGKKGEVLYGRVERWGMSDREFVDV